MLSRRGSRRARSRKAFTLMEVLLVLAILVILGSLAVFAFRDTQNRAKISSAKVQIAALENPLNQYLLDFGSYPANLDLLYNPPPLQNGQASGKYVSTPIPPDPWGNPYVYQQPGQHNPDSYDLFSSGPGPGGEIGNWKN